MGDFLYGKSVAQTVKALDLCVKRQRIIGSNIANRDTPGYKAKQLAFQQALERASSAGQTRLTRTHPDHIDVLPGAPSPDVSERPGESRVDGNSVHLSEEMGRMVENSYLYQALLRSVNHKFKLLKTAIEGG